MHMPLWPPLGTQEAPSEVKVTLQVDKNIGVQAGAVRGCGLERGCGLGRVQRAFSATPLSSLDKKRLGSLSQTSKIPPLPLRNSTGLFTKVDILKAIFIEKEMLELTVNASFVFL